MHQIDNCKISMFFTINDNLSVNRNFRQFKITYNSMANSSHTNITRYIVLYRIPDSILLEYKIIIRSIKQAMSVRYSKPHS